MKRFGMGALLVVAALFAIAAVSPAAFAAATVDPAGSYNANGSGTLNPDTSTLTIDCSDVTVSGSTNADGTGTATVTYGGCTESLFGTSCTISDSSITTEIDGTGSHGSGTTDTYTVNNSPSSSISCFGVNCTVTATAGGTAATGAGGTITDGDDPTLTLSGGVRTDGTSLCTGTLSGSATVDSTPDTLGTGNDLSIAA